MGEYVPYAGQRRAVRRATDTPFNMIIEARP